jgi:hypothetical protein
MARISKADYETVVVACDHCCEDCVFNRRDLPNIGPYGGEDVICPRCHSEFRMTGDTTNLPYELFIVAAREHFRGKHYMLAVGSLAQAWELFFSTFAGARYLYRPFFLSPRGQRDLDSLNSLQTHLDRALGRFTFYRLRNLVVNTVAQAVAPQTLDEATIAIAQIASMGNKPSPAAISSVCDRDVKQVLEGLGALSIGTLRNEVLHRRAYRPLRAEVERCLEDELRLLYQAQRALGVRSFEELYSGLV